MELHRWIETEFKEGLFDQKLMKEACELLIYGVTHKNDRPEEAMRTAVAFVVCEIARHDIPSTKERN